MLVEWVLLVQENLLSIQQVEKMLERYHTGNINVAFAKEMIIVCGAKATFLCMIIDNTDFESCIHHELDASIKRFHRN